MSLSDLSDWLGARLEPRSVWYIKRLSGNDTLANQSHQAGPYIPKDLLFELFPALHDSSRLNPDIEIEANVDSHSDCRLVRIVWYNSGLHGKTRNETRITNWGGRASALLDPDSTGALAIFAFSAPRDQLRTLHVWVCRSPAEEDIVEERLSPVEPGHHLIWRPSADGLQAGIALDNAERNSCRLLPEQMPLGWLASFPSGIELVRKVCELRPNIGQSVDERLVRRRNCEYELFQAVEEVIELPQVNLRFSGVAEFLTHAQRILQRRKSRSGRSLELQARAIFIEEGLVEGLHFSHGPESEPGKRPDFLFPSEAAYKNAAFPAEKLHLLAAKTTCKDRWRQVINEANRIPVKHLLTLQEGVSVTQYAEMKDAGVRLVVPEPLISSYPETLRAELIRFGDFVGSLRPKR